jgi:hypothetical protein
MSHRHESKFGIILILCIFYFSVQLGPSPSKKKKTHNSFGATHQPLTNSHHKPKTFKEVPEKLEA